MARRVLRPMFVRKPKGRGFTLVELSIVVAIIGILAVIAVIGYRKYILHAKITEAQNTISAIRIAQEDYRAERGLYANIGLTTFCPAGAGNATQKYGWAPLCTGGGTLPNWESLPVHIDGPVQFAYATGAGPNTFTGAGAAWVNWAAGAPNASIPWFLILAKCDLDGQDTGSIDTEFATANFTNQVFSRNEGM